MNIRNIIITALDKTTGVLNNSTIAPIILAGGDIDLLELGIDSLTTYEIIMILEDEIGIEISPSTLMSAKSIAELTRSIDRIVQAKA
jgi:acyl carrier protein